jgi:hypothetical protein
MALHEIIRYHRDSERVVRQRVHVGLHIFTDDSSALELITRDA